MKKKNKNKTNGKAHGANGQDIAHDKEVEQLRHELRRVAWELEFLKEAAAFLAKTSRPTTR